MPHPKKYIQIYITIYRNRYFKCNNKGIIDWNKTVEYGTKAQNILLETNHKITLVKYNHGVNTEGKGRWLQVDVDQKEEKD